MKQVTWEEVDNLCARLAQEIRGLPEHTQPEYIYGIPRGGLVPAVILSHKLGIPFVPDDDPKYFLDADYVILIVDDINDSGETINEWQDWENALTIVLYERETSAHWADFVGELINHNGWLVFPWESLENATYDMAEYLESRLGV